jgi:HAD superfamily hydrolase (TIGR01549 family)
MIKAILFDFGQTLVDSAKGFREAEKEVQVKIFNDLDIMEWEEFISVYRMVRREFHANSKLSRVEIWTEVYNRLSKFVDTQLLEKWEYDYWNKVKVETTPFPETEQVLRNLNLKYLMALITNTQGQKPMYEHRINLFPQLERFFKTIIIAGESGIPPKPDCVPFLTCLKNLGVTADEAVYVGDDWQKDICGARDAGIRPIWLQHHLVRRTWPDMKSLIQVITSLDKLLEL